MHDIDKESARRKRRHAAAVGLALATLLSGCAMAQDPLASALVAPGKYEFYDCATLAGTAKQQETKLQEYEKLMAKAAQSPIGGLVNATTYQPDYAALRGELNDVRRTQRAKGCEQQEPGKKAAKPPSNLMPKR
jgi:hypothetical protein